MCGPCKPKGVGKIKKVELKCKNISMLVCGCKSDDSNVKTSICLNKVMPIFSDYPEFKLYKPSVCV